MPVDQPRKKMAEDFMDLPMYLKKEVFYYSTFNFSAVSQIEYPEISDKVRGAREELKSTIFSSFEHFNIITNEDEKEDIMAKHVDDGQFGDHLIAALLQEHDTRRMVGYKANQEIAGKEFDVREARLDNHLFEIKRIVTGSTLQNDIQNIADIPEVAVEDHDNYFLYCLCPLIGETEGAKSLSRTLQYLTEEFIHEVNNDDLPPEYLNVRVLPVNKGSAPRENLQPMLTRPGKFSLTVALE